MDPRVGRIGNSSLATANEWQPRRLKAIRRSDMDQFTVIFEQRCRWDIAQFVACRTIKSKTGCGSPGEADIAFSTSRVAA